VVYVIAALMTLTLAIVLSRLLPPETERPVVRYGELLRSAVHYFATESLLRRRAIYGAFSFGAFSVFWTTMAFLLSGAPYHYNDLTIVCSASSVPRARCVPTSPDAGRTVAGPSPDVGLCRPDGAVIPALWWGRHSLVMVIVGILILDVGTQGLQVTNQSLIYRLAPHARSRITRPTWSVTSSAGRSAHGSGA